MRSAIVLSLSIAAATPLAAQGCGPSTSAPATRSIRVPARGVLAQVGDVKIMNGGFGSGMARGPAGSNVIYLLTDRGPNFDAGPDTKKFPLPSFAPQIGRFRLTGSQLVLDSVIQLRSADGSPLSGLPNPPGKGGTGEIAQTVEGKLLEPDASGLDPEGLVLLGDGSFWISDEYGPYLLHASPSGRTVQRITPFGGTPAIPAVFARRRANRGFEGIALLPRSGSLLAVTQSPLDNPKAAGRSSRAARLLRFDPKSGETRQYVYLLEEPHTMLSDAVALSDEKLLVLELDANLPDDEKNPSTHQRIYAVDLTGATDVSDPANSPDGKRWGSDRWTLEEIPTDRLATVGIQPVKKTLVADLLALGYPHNKPEGIAVLDDSTLVISNDDDFGIVEYKRGVATKVLPRTGAPDFNELFVVRVRMSK